MHPLLSDRKKLSLYLLAWVPVAVSLARLIGAGDGLRWTEALALAAPMSAVYAMICLSSAYLCRFVPPRAGAIATLLGANVAAAAAAAGLWTAAGRALAAALGAGEPYARREAPVFAAGLLLYLLAAVFHYALFAAIESREARARESEARALAREAELRALRAQVNPHFLFNSLHSIAALAGADAARARQMCALLSDLLRASLSFGGRELTPLEDELALARAYLAIEQVRFGARLRVEESIEEEVRSWPTPALLLQPLVENAVGHGVATLAEGGAISISALRVPSGLLVVIENEYDPEEPPRRKNGVGLANVRKRLEARYGREARLDVEAAGGRFRVELMIP
jgi:two-component system sensor histidine kinase AlgZ